MAALLLLTAAVYAPALDAPWQFDDHVGVAADPAARDASLWWRDLDRHVRPVLKASHVAVAAVRDAVAAGDTADAGSLAAWQHAGNVAVHLGAVWLAYALARALQRRFRGAGPTTSGTAATTGTATTAAAGRTTAWIAALVLALHPLSTEAVSYVSGRSASLATALSMAALWVWLRVRDAPPARAAVAVAGGTLLWLAAAGTREAAWVLPLAWACVEGLAPARIATPGAPPPRRLRTAGVVVGALLATLMVGLVALALVHPRYAPLLELSARIAEARAGTPTFASAFAHLGCVALLACAPTVDPQPAAAGWVAGVVTLALCAALAVAGWRARRRQPLLAFAVAWALLWLLPTYLVPVRHDVVAERHAYPAVWSLGIGLAVLASAGAARWRRAPRGALATPALALAGLALATWLATRSLERNREWRSEVALWSAALREAPRPTPRILNNLGVALLEASRWAEAERVLGAAQALAPDDDSVAVNRERARRRSLH